MSFLFIAKAGAPLLIGGGLGTGGVFLYKKVMPISWKDYLEREGVELAKTDDDYKALFADSESIRQEVESLKNVKDSDTNYQSKVKEWCEKELKENQSNDSKKENQLIKLCSYGGITTVKGKIAQKGKHDWIKDNEDDKYKTVFAIYRYSSDFLNWLNEGKGDSNKIQQSDTPDGKYTELKNKCKSESKELNNDSKNKPQIYNYVYWWCSNPKYTKVEERIKGLNKDWEKEEDENAIETTWKHTETITNLIKADLSKQTSDTLTASDYKSWCTTQLEKKLNENGIFKDKYTKIKSVCKKRKKTT